MQAALEVGAEHESQHDFTSKWSSIRTKSYREPNVLDISATAASAVAASSISHSEQQCRESAARSNLRFILTSSAMSTCHIRGMGN